MLHNNDLMHQNLKLQNILVFLDKNMEIKVRIADYGVFGSQFTLGINLLMRPPELLHGHDYTS